MTSPHSQDSWDDFGDPEDEILPDPGEFDTETEVSCPHCGESVSVGLDPGSGAIQDYVDDCEVCCRPWRVQVRYDDGGTADVWLEPL